MPDALGIGALIGQGLKSFVESYRAANQDQRDQADAEERRGLLRRQHKLEEAKSGYQWDPKTESFNQSPDGSGSIQSKRQLEAAKGLLDTYKTQYSALDEDQKYTAEGQAILKWMNEAASQAAALQRRMVGGAAGVAAEPKPEREFEAIRSLDDAGAAASPMGGGLAKPQVSASPVMQAGVPAPTRPKGPGMLGGSGLGRKQQKALAQHAAQKQYDLSLAPQEKMASELGTTVANQTSIANSIREGLKQLEDPNMAEDMKVIVGREMLKTLNSQQGKDAIGAEEAKRLGGLLEYKFFNVTDPGPLFGRSVPKFTEQVKNNLSRLEGSMKANREAMTGQKPSSLIQKEQFPRTIKKGNQQATVSNARELKEALAEGWQ